MSIHYDTDKVEGAYGFETDEELPEKFVKEFNFEVSKIPKQKYFECEF